jgi:methylenetetrahydrofolate reductase (NADPH)
MHIQDIFASQKPTLSFEFFPPKTSANTETLLGVIKQLAKQRPAFVSVTYGAGGSTRDLTRDLVTRIKRETDLLPIPHLTSIGHRKGEISEVLESYAKLGVRNILALRGDPPKTDLAATGELPFARDLVQFIRGFQNANRTLEAPGFGVGVAGFPEGHPSTPNRLQEMENLKAKVDAGADYICTQLFFDNRDFFDFRERCELAGIHVPIIAGIFPITATTNLRRLADLAAGARFPAKLLRMVQQAGSDSNALNRMGIDHAIEQCAELKQQGVSGIHIYTMNQSAAAEAISENVFSGMAK